MLTNVCLDDIFRTADHFDTKLGVVMQHHEPEYCADKLVSCLQCQGRSKGLYDQNMTTSTHLLNSWSICNQTWFGSTAS